MTMASRIAVMSEGRFLQVGAPAEIYETPASRFVADFIGNVNLMDGTLVEDEADHVVVDCGDMRHRVGHGITGTRGMAVTVALRPEKIRIRRDALTSPAVPEAGRQPGARHDQAMSPTSAASPSTTCRWRAAASSRSARATSSASRARR